MAYSFMFFSASPGNPCEHVILPYVYKLVDLDVLFWDLLVDYDEYTIVQPVMVDRIKVKELIKKGIFFTIEPVMTYSEAYPQPHINMTGFINYRITIHDLKQAIYYKLRWA
jgi:hypothetical protein